MPLTQSRFAVRNSRKKVPDQLLVCGIGDLWALKILNGKKLILDDQGNHLDSIAIGLDSFRSFKGPLLHKAVTGQELFFGCLTVLKGLLFSKNMVYTLRNPIKAVHYIQFFMIFIENKNKSFLLILLNGSHNQFQSFKH